ncbi:glycosyltransferase [Hymenobacter profundi]|uniref:Glycosyltransferase n=1 Tax=Hymenobacter profundi TaxID=1982110 RepID=A0ABS6WWE8_9BACT|nr:glycosyltransferase [Hymenobacter profundi]MBW3127592.1 glycosyltransferase [Hymenobacter profundi]
MKPTWSVTIPTYNSAAFLEETLLSVLKQDLGEERMEIIVVDNCSTDNTEEIVEKTGGGRIKFYSNDENIGAIGNFNRCLEAATGELIHILNSDDLVILNFYKEIENCFEANAEASLVVCTAELIDESGKHKGYSPSIESLSAPSDDIEELIYTNPVRTPAVVVKKNAYLKVGKFDKNLSHVADWDMWVRIISNFKGVYLDKVLCKYRVHSKNETSRVFFSGEDILEYERIFQKFESMGYPIENKKYKQILKKFAENNYSIIYSKYRYNKEAVVSLRAIYKRYASPLEYLKLAVKLKYLQ